MTKEELEIFIANRAIVGKVVEVCPKETSNLLDAILYLDKQRKELEFAINVYECDIEYKEKLIAKLENENKILKEKIK